MDEVMDIRRMAMENNDLFGSSLPMIASENVMGPIATEMLISDFEHRYAEGKPGERYYQGCRYVDEVERKAVELGLRLFACGYINVQIVSGTLANLAAFSAFAQPGDVMTALDTNAGAHISHQRIGAAGIRGLKVVHYPYDMESLNIDVDASVRLIREEKPKIVLLGQSLFLFPLPVRELSEAAREVGAKVIYDGAHVLGLIAGKRFQDPLKEGADVLTGSTHKTFPGPQGGIILGNLDEKDAKRMDSAVFPGLVSNHHLHRLAALAVTLAEEVHFGEAYADQIVRNAKAFAQRMHELGFTVLGEHMGFTQSHQIAIDVKALGGGTEIADLLERCGIIVNKNMLPYDDPKKPKNPSGLRIGVQELTRCGMREREMERVAELFKEAAMDRKDPVVVRKEVNEIRRGYRRVRYCFNEWDPYKYVKLV
jgi:glycine hydroxymethyltransferase